MPDRNCEVCGFPWVVCQGDHSPGPGIGSRTVRLPPDNLNSRHIQETVRERVERLPADTFVVPFVDRKMIDTIVWETLALLGEWNLIALNPLEPGAGHGD